MERTEVDALAALTVLAAVADGATSDGERDRIKAVLDGLSVDGDAEEARLLAGAQRRVLLRQTSVEAEAAKLASPESRALAFEMAVAVCDADGAHGPQEREFLERLRVALAIDGGVAAATVREADALADIPLEKPVQATASSRVVAGTALPAVPAPPDAGMAGREVAGEVDASILRYAILNGGLELLPQGLATLAIVPLQMKMVYGVGKAYGVTLDRGHVKEFIATVGVGMTSQVVENFARNLLGGFARKLGGKTAGKLVGAATGAAMTFATTYAMGQVAKQYYSGGRRLSSVDLRALFAREVERAKGLYAQYRPQVEQSARNTDASQLLGMVRGA